MIARRPRIDAATARAVPWDIETEAREVFVNARLARNG